MRSPNDSATLELPGIKPPPVTKKRGRPALHANAAARQRAYVARNGIVPMTVQLPEALHAEFMTWLTSKGKKQSTVIAHLIRTQLLRKR
ncbi:hypothetical protein JAB8_06070 [Janthinobacterium sp. HH106]|uniref:hypothetical protein n=1 Tax=Janthinobacterium sp. HH106 TaxID=1537278 RepID=UPI000873F0FD|nr:hypothetical protein [Janthinobacterium sp. HH106]OEZ93491.1 hypothetical protein JAB8_06070 [Janthinobacterium sp. HH106]